MPVRSFPPVPLDTELRFGSHLFINPEDTALPMRRHVATLRKAGFRLIRLFLPWSQLEPRPGEWKWSPYAEVFDEAQAQGMAIVATLMSVSPPGHLGMTWGIQDVADLDDTVFFERSLDHVRTVVNRFKQHPALDSWILWNEPSRALRPDQPTTWRAFQRYLKRLYHGDIAAYNQAHFQPSGSFEEIRPHTSAAYETGFASHRDKVEWLSFTVENLQEKIEAIAGQIRELDPVHPIHVNPHRVSQCLSDLGQSIWRQAELTDFIGCSAHPAWHSVRFPRDRYGDSIAMFADLARSATQAVNRYFWVTELQGGTTLLSAFEPLAPTPAEARTWLWQCVAAGAKAVIYWCANARTDGYEAGEWDLLDCEGHASPRLVEIGQTIEQIDSHRALLSEAHPVAPDVGILVSEESQTLDLADGNGNDPGKAYNCQKGADAVSGAYLMTADLSLETLFYNQARLRATPPEALPRVLLAPSLAVLEAETIYYLHAAVKAGVLLIGDGFFAWKDRYGRLARQLADPSAELWGAGCLGYEALAKSRNAHDKAGNVIPGWFARAALAPLAAEVVAAWDDQAPAVVRHAIGAGAACRIGTHFFQHYLTKPDPAALKWLAAAIAPSLAPARRLVNSGPTLRLRRLRAKSGEIAIVINSGLHAETAWVRELGASEPVALLVPAQNALVLAPHAAAPLPARSISLRSAPNSLAT